MGPDPQASHQKGPPTRPEGPPTRKKFPLRLSFAAKARRAKETKEKIMERDGDRSEVQEKKFG
jgi:hypothetical protein